MPRISVIMSTRNDRETLPAAIEPFLFDTLDIEVVIVNDASDDGTREYLDRLAAQHPSKVRPLHRESSIGLTRALNLAIRESRGEFLARQDADDVSHPDRLRKQLARFDADPSLDFLGTGNRIVEPDGDLIVAIRGQNFGNLAKRLVKGNVFCHGSLMMRRSALLEIGGYDEYFRFAQDYDLLLRAVRAGRKLANLEECLYDWTFSSKSITSEKTAEQRWYSEAARREFLEPGWKGRHVGPPVGATGGPKITREHQLISFYLLACEPGMARRVLRRLPLGDSGLLTRWKTHIQCSMPSAFAKAFRFLNNLRYS
jgi:glycosyltransferase involved in cell wall biosynthesis